MKENVFIQRNIDKWKRISNELNANSWALTDTLADYYLEITSDLAYAQTHYPNSEIIDGLNNLAFSIHNRIYRKKGLTFRKFIRLWTHDLPLVMYEARYMLLISFVIFSVFTFFGVISQINNPDYARSILGDSYVDMTLDNIAKGKPVHVYASSPEMESFFSITFNNLMVDLRTFASGLLTSIGTIFILFYNALMLGSFQTFFFQHGTGWESVLAIWQHGALEIPTIILAGAAGITLGNGWIFPKTYSRIQAFKNSARQGLKIIAGVIPITIVAGFIEGFITRHTELPDPIRITTIVCEFAFILFYFVILPKRIHKKEGGEHV